MHWSKSPVTFPSGMVILQGSGSCSPAWEGQTEEEGWKGSPPPALMNIRISTPRVALLNSLPGACPQKGKASPRPSGQAVLFLYSPLPALFSTPCHEAPLSLEASRSPPSGIKKELDTVTPEVLSTLAHLLGPLGSSPSLPPRTWSQLSDRSHPLLPTGIP